MAEAEVPSELVEVKVVVLGDAGVGKTSIARRFVSNHFRDYSESTIGASFLAKILVVDDKAFKFHIWDTAGQEKYHGLAPMYYRNAVAAVVVFDITDRTSFGTLQTWVKELREKGPENIIMTVVGNKSDLESQRQVSSAQAKEYADSNNAMFFETSAKEDTNVSAVFTEISKRLPRNIAPPTGGLQLAAAMAEPGKPAKSGCC
eukprot:TRINITY_DN4858_c0_g1_i1.p1 TRINITY_DN4858_c0_g1~~TRINITY_DN4858_c0_g1_i1.p1  ORF type:complete len:203 (+),score=36.55 TRINITY_DN4858_c0_g1_i1:86-694(+)